LTWNYGGATEDPLAVEELRQIDELLTLRSEAADWRWTLRLRPAAGLPEALRVIDERSQAGDHAEAMAALTTVMPGLRGAEHAEAIKLRGDLQHLSGEVTAAPTRSSLRR